MRHAPTLNGRVEGSVQVMTAENVTFNGGAHISGDLLLPGMPTVQLNGTPTYGGALDGTGAATPTNHKVTLNGSSTLGRLVRRTDPVALPIVARPPQPAGTRSVSLNNSSQTPGDFATLKNLTLNSNVGPVIVPPGTYGNFNANAGSGFTLGVAGATTPTVYHFQNLTLNSNSTFTVVGPVVVTVDGGFSTNGDLGNADHSEWLKLRIAGGGLSINGNRTVYAHLEAPEGNLTLNGGSRFVGAVASDRLTINGNAVLRLIAPVSNQPPVVTLTAGAGPFIAPASVTLVASASDPDGTVARVEFFQGATKLGEDTITPFEWSIGNLAAGLHTYRAKAVDNVGAATESADLVITVTAPQAQLPYYAGFETGEGYQLGPLDGQRGWQGGAGVVVTDADFSAGTHAALVPGQQPSLGLVRPFASSAADGTIFVDFRVLPYAAGAPADSAQFEVAGAARVTLVRQAEAGYLAAYDGDGQGQGTWRILPGFIPLEPSGYAADWFRVTTRLDYAARKWDLYVNNRLAAYDLGFLQLTQAGLGDFTLTGHASEPTLLDEFRVGLENPLFADADRDGLDDAWETSHGLDPTRNDRATDPDADTLSNLEEFRFGTKPDLVDSDADGLFDADERLQGTNPLLADSDADGLPDGWEQARGLDPRSPADAALDADGDGLSNLQEYQQGKDPHDYYNGALPDIASLVPSDGALGPGDSLMILVTDRSGAPLVNAPVRFVAITGGHLFATTMDGPPSGELTVRTDIEGIALVYVKPGLE